ncbi:16175_t:CDS:2 [Entrophospora sp. SA101]|nr:16175_t:CDS:2 [Entrophospora sp. SA101]
MAIFGLIRVHPIYQNLSYGLRACSGKGMGPGIHMGRIIY